MIVVATADFELYHDLVGELRDRGVVFTTIEPGADLPEGATVVLSGADEPVDAPGVEHVVATTDAPRDAVETALATVRGGEGRTVVGVDPGTRPGIAVLSGDVVVAAFHVPLADAVAVVQREVADAPDPVVRVGDGARIQGATILNELEDVRVELVDETGTTPHLGAGARGMGDVLAAVNIARLSGVAVESREVDPTEGELQRIKNRSRRVSADSRTIDEGLARRVAAGDLTVEEALERHRRQTGDDENDEDDEDAA